MENFQPIQHAPKDSTRLLLWNPYSLFWIGSWRLPAPGEPQCDTHYVYEWRDENGRWASPVLFAKLPTTVELNRVLRATGKPIKPKEGK